MAVKERDFREDRRKTDLLRLKLKQREAELKLSGLGEMNRFLADSRRTFERLVQDIREGQLTTERIKEVRGFLSETGASLNEQRETLLAEELATALEDSPPEPMLPAGTPVLGFTEGRDVYVEPGNRRGTLVRKAGKGKWVVLMGGINAHFTIPRRALAAHDPCSSFLCWRLGHRACVGHSPVCLESRKSGLCADSTL